MKLFDSEWKVMEVLWQENDRTAKEISLRLADSIGWNKNTTYTVIKRLIDKGAITREDPGFICRANITKRKIQEIETKALLNQMYNGSLENFIQSYLANQKFSESERNELQKLLSGQGR